MAHAQVPCEQCGQEDDHPKFHLADADEVRSFHHDCIPARVLEDNADHPHLHRIVEAAKSGTRGAALRKHIAKLHEEN